MPNKKPRVIYTGNGTEIGIFFGKTVGSDVFCSFAARAEDGEITSIARKLPYEQLPKTPFEKLKNLFIPQKSDEGFKRIIKLELKENKGKIRPNLDLEKELPKEKAAAPILMPIIMVIYAVLPTPLNIFLQNSVSTNVIAAIVPPVAILSITFGAFGLFIKGLRTKFHGAEHMAIACLQAGEEPTITNIRKYSRVALNCGTNVLSTALFISGLIATAVMLAGNIYNPFIGLLIRTFSFPVAYFALICILKATIRSQKPVVRVILNIICAPGLFLQYAISTKDPDDEQLEVAIVGAKALNALK